MQLLYVQVQLMLTSSYAVSETEWVVVSSLHMFVACVSPGDWQIFYYHNAGRRCIREISLSIRVEHQLMK